MSSKKISLLIFVFTLLVAIFIVTFGVLGDSSVGGSPEKSLINVSANIIFWKIISFAFLVSAVSFMWEKIIKFLDSRNEKVLNDINSAENNKIASEKLLFENQKILNDSIKRADLILEESKSQASKIKEQILKEAKLQADILIDKSMKEIDLYKADVLEKIKNEVAGLSIYIASKIIAKSLNVSDHKKIIDNAISEYKISC